MSYEIDWTEHPALEDLDDWVKANLPTYDEWNKIHENTNSIPDVRTSALGFVSDQINKLRDLTQMIEALPKDDSQTFTIEEEEDEVI